MAPIYDKGEVEQAVAKETNYQSKKRKEDLKREKADVLRAELVKARLSGLSYSDIGKQAGISAKKAHDIIDAAIDEMNRDCAENLGKVRDIEVQRLDAMLEKLWPNRAEPKTADVILRLAKRRSDLLGLDAAQRSEMKITGLEGLTDDQLAKRMEELGKKLAQRTTDEAYVDPPESEEPSE